MAGDWNDVDAAVEVGAGQAECVVVRAEPTTETDRVYRLKHSSGKTGVLKVRSEPGPDPRSMDITCSMGPLGDAGLERLIVARVSRRLEDLKGVEFAPIRE